MQELRQAYRSDGHLNDLAEKSVQDILESGVKRTALVVDTPMDG